MSVFTLKLLALFFMVIDHIGYFFISDETYYLYRAFGRISAPIFLFLFTEGYLKTSNRKKYGNRLLTFSIVLFVGNVILKLFLKDNMYPLNTNIIFTMYLCFLFLNNVECKERNIGNKILLGTLTLILIYFAEYSFLALLCVIIFYLYNKKYFSKLQAGLLFVLMSIGYCLLMSNLIQVFMVMAIVPILLYNGKLGYKNKYIQLFYYWFYMIHLWIFTIISQFI